MWIVAGRYFFLNYRYKLSLQFSNSRKNIFSILLFLKSCVLEKKKKKKTLLVWLFWVRYGVKWFVLHPSVKWIPFLLNRMNLKIICFISFLLFFFFQFLSVISISQVTKGKLCKITCDYRIVIGRSIWGNLSHWLFFYFLFFL